MLKKNLENLLIGLTLFFGCIHNNSAQNKINAFHGFTFITNEKYPDWLEAADRKYLINDDRVSEVVNCFGGYTENMGEIFFIGGDTISINSDQISITQTKYICKYCYNTLQYSVSKKFKHKNYQILFFWKTGDAEGAYQKGLVKLIKDNKIIYQSDFFMVGF
jgi:hypothetical protein